MNSRSHHPKSQHDFGDRVLLSQFNRRLLALVAQQDYGAFDSLLYDFEVRGDWAVRRNVSHDSQLNTLEAQP